MKILVTGGAGFIGSHITDLLIQKNHNVVILDNLSTGKSSNLNPKAKFYQVDITQDLSSLFKTEKPELVIHLAAQVMLRKSLESPLEDAKTNILGTLNILENCKNYKVKKIIYTSTGGARVGNPQYLPVDETHPLNPLSPYGISKHTAEHYVWMYSQLYNLDYLIFCFGNVYGPRDDPSSNRLIPLFITKMLNNESPKIFGDGTQTRDFIYVLDLAEFIVDNLNKNPESKLFHLANGIQISVNQIVSILKKELNFKKDIPHLPAVKGEVKDIVLDTRLVRKELNWQPTHSIEAGLKATIKYFKER